MNMVELIASKMLLKWALKAFAVLWIKMLQREMWVILWVKLSY